MVRFFKQGWLAIVTGMIVIPSAFSVAETPVDPRDLIESMAFLESYRSTGGAQSPAFYELYSDRAVVHLRTVSQDHAVVFAGRVYKQWGRELLASGRTALDASVFHDATVEQRGHRLVIRAKRYSTARCYWDLGYEVGIEPEGTGYRVVDEQLTMNPGASCATERSTQGMPLTAPVPMRQVMGASSSPHTPGVSTLPELHPWSSRELTEKAHQLAQLASARSAMTTAITLPSRAGPPQRLAPGVTQPVDNTLAVRITPRETP